MSDSYIQVAPDGAGKRLQTFGNTISGNLVEAEAVTLVTSAGAEIPLTTQRTPASSVVSTSGTVAAGKQSVLFVPSSDFTGTLLGADWPDDDGEISFSTNGPAETLAAIPYTVTTGSITIVTIT